MKILIAATLGLATAGCMTTGMAGGEDEHPGAHATLEDAQGRTLAVSEVGEQGGALYVVIDATGMRPGRYAAHIHTTGRCDGPSFESAGGHWNPTGRSHGLDADHGAHLGDLPNLAVNAGGRGVIAFQIQGASLQGGVNPLLDADGASVIIHAGEDDFRTDPSGNSGARIACGVLRRAG